MLPSSTEKTNRLQRFSELALLKLFLDTVLRVWYTICSIVGREFEPLPLERSLPNRLKSGTMRNEPVRIPNNK